MTTPTPDDALREVTNEPSIFRKWQAMADRIAAGESEDSVLDDYGLVRSSVVTVMRMTHEGREFGVDAWIAPRVRCALTVMAAVEAAPVVTVSGFEFGASNTFVKVAVHGDRASELQLGQRVALVRVGEG